MPLISCLSDRELVNHISHLDDATAMEVELATRLDRLLEASQELERELEYIYLAQAIASAPGDVNT